MLSRTKLMRWPKRAQAKPRGRGQKVNGIGTKGISGAEGRDRRSVSVAKVSEISRIFGNHG